MTPPKKPSPLVTKMVRITMPEDTWTNLRVKAAREGTSVTGWLSHAAWQYVESRSTTSETF